jgi:hypothetical protein
MFFSQRALLANQRQIPLSLSLRALSFVLKSVTKKTEQATGFLNLDIYKQAL